MDDLTSANAIISLHSGRNVEMDKLVINRMTFLKVIEYE